MNWPCAFLYLNPDVTCHRLSNPRQILGILQLEQPGCESHPIPCATLVAEKCPLSVPVVEPEPVCAATPRARPMFASQVAVVGTQGKQDAWPLPLRLVFNLVDVHDLFFPYKTNHVL
ncbi:MAG: hypothetical protein H7839_19000 [Magnetococcus sp. YQC-5]